MRVIRIYYLIYIICISNIRSPCNTNDYFAQFSLWINEFMRASDEWVHLIHSKCDSSTNKWYRRQWSNVIRKKKEMNSHLNFACINHLWISFIPPHQCVAHTRTHSNRENWLVRRMNHIQFDSVTLKCQANWMAPIRRHCSQRTKSTSDGCHLISFPLRRQIIDKKNEVQCRNIQF